MIDCFVSTDICTLPSDRVEREKSTFDPLSKGEFRNQPTSNLESAVIMAREIMALQQRNSADNHGTEIWATLIWPTYSFPSLWNTVHVEINPQKASCMEMKTYPRKKFCG